VTLKSVIYEPRQLYAAPAYDRPGITFRITNLDEVNTIWLDTDQTITPNSTPLPPQASAVYDGSTDVWASTLTQGLAVAVDYAPGSLYYDNPVGVQIALNALGLATAANQVTQNNTAAFTNDYLGGTAPGALISAAGLSVAKDMLHANSGVTSELAALLASGSPSGTPGGVPLLNLDQQVTQQTTLVVGSTTTLGPFSIDQPSYVGALSFVNGAAGGASLTIFLNWTDGAGNNVHVDAINLWAGTGASPHIVMFEGPTRGTEVSITLTVSASSTLNFYDFYQSSRIITKHQYRSNQWLASNVTGTVAGNGVPGNVVAVCNASGLAAGGTTTFLLPMYIGRVMIYIQTSSGTSDMQCILRNAADPSAVGDQSLLLMNSTSAGIGFQNDVFLPYTQCSFSLHNGNAATKNLFAVITGTDY
jgi:hypothetical protein